MDKIPKDIAEAIAEDGKRNHLIVDHYIQHQEKYGKTLVFAINRLNASALKAIFEAKGIAAGVIVSGTSAEFTGIDISDEINQENIRMFKANEIDVLINVNILTEGVDLPKTQTVFLTRPTVSTILMTQMIGRALRGEKAGGTKDAYIVSFVDDWKEKIAWANPESVIIGEPSSFLDSSRENKYAKCRIISIAKLEEFARLLDRTIDTHELESIEFIKRIPLGFYSFQYLESTKNEDDIERNHQILIYDSTKDHYENMIKELPVIFKAFDIQEEVLNDNQLAMLLKTCEEAYFSKRMIPTYDQKDIKALLKYYAQKGCSPEFIEFAEVDREELDISTIAKEIIEKDLGEKSKRTYITNIWNESIAIKTYYNKFEFFRDQLQKEIDKNLYGIPQYSIPEVEPMKLNPRKIPLYKIKTIFPEYYDELIQYIDKNYKTDNGEYFCAMCNKQSKYRGLYQVDHIIPMSKGGESVHDNLQLLCKWCNQKKSDHIEKL